MLCSLLHPRGSHRRLLVPLGGRRAGQAEASAPRSARGTALCSTPWLCSHHPPRMWMRTWRRDGEGARSWRGWRGWRGASERGAPPPHPRGEVGEEESNARGRTRRSNWRFSIAGRSGLRGGVEVRIGGKSRRLARSESPRRDLLPRPRLSRGALVVALSLSLSSARLGSARSLSPSVPAAVVPPRREIKRVRGRKQALKMDNLLRGASPGLKRGRLEVVKYASRREIYTAVSNLDARNARTGGPRVEIACCGACGATFPPNLPIFPSVLERLESVLERLRAS